MSILPQLKKIKNNIEKEPPALPRAPTAHHGSNFRGPATTEGREVQGSRA